MKTCTKCKRQLPESLFCKDKKNRSGFHSWCRACKGEAIRALRETRYDENRRRALAMFGNRCARCGRLITPDGMRHYNFHHSDASMKEVNISYLLLGPWEKVEVELEQCVLLDTGCHRVAHTTEKEIWCL